MTDLEQYISMILGTDFKKIIISNPATKSEKYQKMVVEKKKDFCQIAKYTEKQVFHENVKADAVLGRCVELIDGHYRQVNGMTKDAEHIILISKNGICNYKVKRLATEAIRAADGAVANEHNRKKNYILSEGMNIEPLVDMGVFTRDGRV
ncbi:MAG: SAM-dependent methyltransferase, partial [Lachnospiraceae bacterium]